MKRVISVLVGVVIAVVFGQAPTSAATLVTTAPATHVAAHDGHGNAAALTGTVTERGSPAPYGGDHLDVADRCSHGGSAHPEGVAPGAISTYDDHATLVQVAQPTGTTREQLRWADDELFVDRSGLGCRKGRIRSCEGGDLCRSLFEGGLRRPVWEHLGEAGAACRGRQVHSG